MREIEYFLSGVSLEQVKISMEQKNQNIQMFHLSSDDYQKMKHFSNPSKKPIYFESDDGIYQCV